MTGDVYKLLQLVNILSRMWFPLVGVLSFNYLDKIQMLIKTVGLQSVEIANNEHTSTWG